MKGGARILAANFALAALALAFSIAVAEALLRGLGPPASLQELLTLHPQLGWTFEPGRERPGRKKRRSPPALFNRLGFSDLERPFAKPPGVRRVVVLGDSYAAGLQVPLEATFPRRLEELLNASGPTPWEVVSLAVTGYGTAQERIALELHGLAFDPDVVVLQIFTNDVCNNSIAAADYCAFNNEFRPYFVEEGGDLRVTTTQPFLNLLRTSSRVFQLAEHALRAARMELVAGGDGRVTPARQREIMKEQQGRRIRRDLGTTLHPFWLAYAPDHEQIPMIAEGWRITERLVEAISDRLQELGIPLVAVLLPAEETVDDAAWSRLSPDRAPGASATAVAGIPTLVRDYPERRLGRLFQRLGRPIAVMLPAFMEHSELVLPYRRYHLNREGHRLVAEALRDLVVESVIAPGTGRTQPDPWGS